MADWQEYQRLTEEQRRRALGFPPLEPPGGKGPGCWIVLVLIPFVVTVFLVCAAGTFDPFLNRLFGRGSTNDGVIPGVGGPDDAVLGYLRTAPDLERSRECEKPDLATLYAQMDELRAREDRLAADMRVDVASLDAEVDGDEATADTVLSVVGLDPDTAQEKTTSFRVGYRFGLVNPDGDRWLVCSATFLGER